MTIVAIFWYILHKLNINQIHHLYDTLEYTIRDQISDASDICDIFHSGEACFYSNFSNFIQVSIVNHTQLVPKHLELVQVKENKTIVSVVTLYNVYDLFFKKKTRCFLSPQSCWPLFSVCPPTKYSVPHATT